MPLNPCCVRVMESSKLLMHHFLIGNPVCLCVFVPTFVSLWHHHHHLRESLVKRTSGTRLLGSKESEPVRVGSSRELTSVKTNDQHFSLLITQALHSSSPQHCAMVFLPENKHYLDTGPPQSSLFNLTNTTNRGNEG